jgi:predicted nucleic acid-binding protein
MNSGKYNVISDTTPLIALASINKLELLPVLFHQITIAETVKDEINYGGKIKIPSLETIEWIKITNDIKGIKERLLFELDEGERQTILIGLEGSDPNKENLLLIDERKGRKVATSLGIKIKGTLGVLADARKRGLIDNFRNYAFKLLDNNLYYDLRLIESIAEEVDK